MEQILNDLSSFVKQKRLFPAEQLIMLKLIDLDSLIPISLPEQEFQNIESILLQLFSINDGALSYQCSVRISKTLVKIYKSQNPPKLWNMFQLVIKNPSRSNISGLAYVISNFRHSSRSSIPNIVKVLISKAEKFTYECLNCLAECFNADRSSLKSFVSSAMSLAMRHQSSSDENIQLSCIRLVSSILFTGKESNDKVFHSFISAIMQKDLTIFVMDEISYFIAKMAFRPFEHILNHKNNKEKGEFSLAKKTDSENEKLFEHSFNILTQYSSLFHSVLGHFLDLMPVEFIYQNLALLFNFVRKINPDEVSQLVTMFGSDVRKELFNSVANERPPSPTQLSLLKILSLDDTTVHTIAEIALKLMESEEPFDRRCAAEYFSFLEEEYPQIAEDYLIDSLNFLSSSNGEDNVKEIEIHGTIATYILGASKYTEEYANEYAKYIGDFILKALSIEDVLDINIRYVLAIMTVLPNWLVAHELVPSILVSFNNYLTSRDGSVSSKSLKLRDLGNVIALFLMRNYKYEDISYIFTLFSSNTAIMSQTSTACMFSVISVYPFSIDNICNVTMDFISNIMKNTPPDEFCRSKIKYPMSTGIELIETTKTNNKLPNIFYDEINLIEFCEIVYASIPKIMLRLKPDVAEDIVNLILDSEQNLHMRSILILAICKDNSARNVIPEGLHIRLLDMMDDSLDDLLLQIISECIAIWVKDDFEAIQQTFIHIKKDRSLIKCFVYCSMFTHTALDEKLIATMMHELDDIAKNTIHTPYALHALTVLYYTHSIELGAMKIIDIQCQVMVQLLNQYNIIRPFNLYNISKCFTSLLPILSPNISSERASIIPNIRLIVQIFRLVSTPYSLQISNRTMRAVYAFARNIIDDEQMTFPHHLGSSIPLMLSACGAFADRMKYSLVDDHDFFTLLPKLFILLQRSEDKRASEFIQVIAECFFAKGIEKPNDPDVRTRLVEWIKIVKIVLSQNSLPKTGDASIESGIQVKNCCLVVTKVLLPLLVKSSPLLTECLDDIMTSVTRSIETKSSDLYALSFQIVSQVIESFENVRAEGGNRLLELYDSQFSIAVRFGFNIDLAISGNFLIKYLAFHYDNLKQKPDEFATVLNGYIIGLKTCQQKIFALYMIASYIFSIAKQNKKVFEKVESFAQEFVPCFGEIVKTSMELWREDPPNWQKIAQFRNDYMNFYREMLTSFVWIQSYFKLNIIDVKELITFFKQEISNCTESWRILSAFEALAAAFLYYSSDITTEHVASAIAVVNQANQLSPQLLQTALPSFLLSCSKLINEGEDSTWSQLIEFATKSTFQLESIAHLVKKGPKKSVHSLYMELYDLVIGQLKKKNITDDQTAAFFTILFEKDIDCVKDLSDKVISDEELSEFVRFKLEFLKKAVCRCNNTKIEEIAKFVWMNFRKGGMVTICQLLEKSPEVGSVIFGADKLQIMSELVLNDSNNVVVYLQFIRHGISFNASDEVLTAASSIAIASISQWGEDPQKGKDIVLNAVNLCQDIQRINEQCLKNGFLSSSTRQKASSVSITENQIAKLQTRMKVRTLKTFSNNVARRTYDDDDDGEWQSLD